MSDDLISRKKAVDLLVSEASQDGAYGYLDAKEVHGLLASLPSEQERKTGKWIQKEDPYGFFETIPVCSECGHTTKMRETYNYCPNCGAKMEGGLE